MAKVFLDTNILIGFLEKQDQKLKFSLKGHKLFLSPLSIHISIYVVRQKMPFTKLSNIKDSFSLISFSKDIVDKALLGPTTDFEDNVQLHSAVASDCEFFLTSDQALLKLNFFGKTRIVNSL
ncbi:hypothetical protein A2774_06080 [Candidatus Roizmanbacteria bacterium RIFCSPHIGHO2_01_FULL_39_12c]|uniref:PIN domain-containing protein n=1 Tax=Candidatus Roizmanbacteria bacterium RIFCSPHIGHO2_01_FULL_39_12c TaxID=1802031 RepID=A0A1F7G9J6_9BACT|nr:MAG: hypothetical protein A2774_06080 [Candidatus Roizmanbacteria bacterium RIFCSPHIGHO2_01_FULL_39_12c]OGK47254.1 MAG: hypothetical protein A2963_04275 [Candidatus Roizmanbacteria bacterium RIFCSPLOWO2_01_FULL_40_13]